MEAEENRTYCLFDINHTVSSQSYIHITQYICHVSWILYVYIFAHIKLSTIFLSCKVFHEWSIIKLGNVLYFFSVEFSSRVGCTPSEAKKW